MKISDKTAPIVVNANVKKWSAPKTAQLDIGSSIPVEALPKPTVEWLCKEWLSDVCETAGVEFEVKFFL